MRAASTYQGFARSINSVRTAREGFPLVGTQRTSALHKDPVAASTSCEFKIRTSLRSWPGKPYSTSVSAPGLADKLVGGTSGRRPHARKASTTEAQQTGSEGGKMQSVASLLSSAEFAEEEHRPVERLTATPEQRKEWCAELATAVKTLGKMQRKPKGSPSTTSPEHVHAELTEQCTAAVAVWRAAQAHNCQLPWQLCNGLLYLLAEACERALSNSPPDPESALSWCVIAEEVYAANTAKGRHEGAQYEAAASSLLKCLCSCQKIELAVELLEEVVSHKEAKRRTFGPVLAVYASRRDTESFRTIWDMMMAERARGVTPGEAQLLDAVRVAAPQEAKIALLQVLPELLADVGAEMWPSAVSPSAAAEIQELLGSARAHVVSIARDSDGLCPLTGRRLSLITLTQEDREAMLQGLFQLAREDDRTRKRSRKGQRVATTHRARAGSDFVAERLGTFQHWLQQRHNVASGGRPLRYVVDGANVAYCRQNFGEGGFSFYQINLVLNHLVEVEGCSWDEILLLMPKKYLNDGACQEAKPPRPNLSPRVEVAQEDLDLVQRWRDKGVLEAVPYGADDDWWWLLSCVSDSLTQGFEVVDDSTSVIPSHSQHLPMCITNDNMRDHRLYILESRSFTRFKASQLVRFDIMERLVSAQPEDENKQYEEKEEASDECMGAESPATQGHYVVLTPPPLFSREIQTNMDQTVWHLPIHNSDGPAEIEDGEEWLVITLHC
ncbi:hypothetical protein CYMTET_7728 [Cymbomonas tetramitiformis]|uniref:PROP1-like PPR domain-containing protein n=1 Tax=Cymbomonas tetramitiformis TaxID=36881 RepID=A0AAE0GUV3_9CHLO|nr:hypothetical protein CYMTET_7728 [Cymbomonas tetramitiformis]